MGKLTTDALLYAASTLASRLPGFIFLPLASHLLSPSLIGVLVTSWISIELLLALFSFGMRQALARFLPIEYSQLGRSQIISTALVGSLLASLLFCAVLLLGGFIVYPKLSNYLPDIINLHRLNIIGNDTLNVNTKTIGLLIISGAFFSNIGYFFQVCLRADRRAKAFMASALGAAILECGVLFGLWKTNSVDVINILTIESLRGIWLLVCGAFLMRHSLGLHWSAVTARKMFHYGIWLVPVSFFSWVTFFIDRIWLGWLGDLRWVGLYGVYYRLVAPMTIVFGAYISSLDSHFYTMESSAGYTYLKEKLGKFVSKGALVSIAAATLGTLVLWFLMKNFRLLPIEYLPGLSLVPIFIVSQYIYYVSDHFGSALEFGFRSKARLLVMGLSAACNFILTGLFIYWTREYSSLLLQAAAFSSLLSMVFLMMGQAKIAKLNIESKVFVQFSAAIVLMLLVAIVTFLLLPRA